MIAKLHGAKRKRLEEEEDAEMDAASDADAGEEGWMDVDEDEDAPKKRVKTNAGGVVNKRVPRSNRQMAGMKSEVQFNKANQLRNLAQRPRNMLAKAGEADREIKTKMVSTVLRMLRGEQALKLFFVAQASVCWQARGRKDTEKMIGSLFCISSFFSVFSSPHVRWSISSNRNR